MLTIAPLPPHAARRHQQPNPNSTQKNRSTANNNNSNNNRLYVGSIPWSATEEEVIAACSIFGRVVSFKLVRDKETGSHKGYGFIDFADEESALCAKRNQKGLLCQGRQLKVCDSVNNNKQQRKPPPAPLSSPSTNSSCTPTNEKRPREAEVPADDSANKRLHLEQQQLPNSNCYPTGSQQKQQTAFPSNIPLVPLSVPSHSSYPTKRPIEADAAAGDPESQDSASNKFKRPRVDGPTATTTTALAAAAAAVHNIHVTPAAAAIVMHHKANNPQETENYVEPYSPSKPAIQWPRKKGFWSSTAPAVTSHESDDKQLQSRPTVITHVDYSQALRSAGSGIRSDVLITDQRFTTDLLQLSSLLRSQIAPPAAQHAANAASAATT